MSDDASPSCTRCGGRVHLEAQDCGPAVGGVLPVKQRPSGEPVCLVCGRETLRGSSVAEQRGPSRPSYIYRAESLIEGEWTPISPPSYHRPEREMLEHKAEDEDHDTFTEYRIVRAPLGSWEPEPHRPPCVVEDCPRTVDGGDSYCGLHQVVWGREMGAMS